MYGVDNFYFSFCIEHAFLTTTVVFLRIRCLTHGRASSAALERLGVCAEGVQVGGGG